MATFTNGQPWQATEKDVAAKWGSGFKCGLCARKFVVCDLVRWVYANGERPAYGNFLVCDKCDGDDVLTRWQQAWKELCRFGEDGMVVAMASVLATLRQVLGRTGLMICPNCGKAANFEEKSERWEERHGLDCGPYETGTDRWLECDECGERTDVKEIERAAL